ncbi:hypothetical protein B0O99DRAFT_704810 [Bisporella sp. PMI_857]|nr:hypothetical protein B0O99DRAFT_704810 [Bisporella sp. PMI_857]
MYMVYIRPLTDRWEADRWALYDKMNPPSDFIWHSEIGPWDSSQMSKARGAAKADFEDAGNGNDDEQYEVPDDLAAGHTGQTAANYRVTIDVLKRLTADSLEIFGQVSYRWHRFLRLIDQPPSPSPLKRKAAEAEQPTLLKRPKVLHLERPALETKIPHATTRRSRAISCCERDPAGCDSANWRREELGVYGAGYAIWVWGNDRSSPYAELKRQLVARCLDAGLDCQHWPKARDSWPGWFWCPRKRHPLMTFYNGGGLACPGRLDRVVFDECHLTFTAATEYRRKLRGLVLLRNLGCPFVFLTGTLPPLCQREFEEAMQLQNPRYIRASSHRVNAYYSVLRVRNGRGPMEAKKLVDARLGNLAPGKRV